MPNKIDLDTYQGSHSYMSVAHTLCPRRLIAQARGVRKFGSSKGSCEIGKVGGSNI